MNTDHPPAIENTPRRQALSPDARRARQDEVLARLMLCRTKLTPEQAVQLRRVYPRIFDANYQMVWRLFKRRGVPNAWAQELVQESFTALYLNIEALGFPVILPALLRSIARGFLQNYVRGVRRAPKSVAIPSSKSEPPGSQPDLERAIDLRDLKGEMTSRLSEEHHEVIDEVVIGGLSPREAGVVLGIPEGTVKSRVRAALARLKELAEPIVPESERR